MTERIVKCEPATKLPMNRWSIYLEGKLYRTNLSLADAIHELDAAILVLSDGDDRITGFRPLQLTHPNWTAFTLEPLNNDEADYPDADTFAHWGETDWPQQKHPLFR